MSVTFKKIQLFRRGGGGTPTTGGGTTPTPGDDLTTWPYSGTITTMALPGDPPIEQSREDGGVELVPQDTAPYLLLIDVTKFLPTDAKSATSAASLRFVDQHGARVSHTRTAGGRIIVAGTFYAGLPLRLTFYWGKSGVSQPGAGFPTFATVTAGMRLALIFEGGNPLDISPTPASFTKVGIPTFVTGKIGQAMRCGEGNYVSTTAAKLRGSARDQRHAMALIWLSQGTDPGRTICWADWAANQRAFQLFSSSAGMELYVDSDGVSPFQAWRISSPLPDGWNWIGGSWVAGSDQAIVQLNDRIEVAEKTFADTPTQGQLHNSTSPYIIGGTPVAGNYHAGDVEAAFEFATPTSQAQMQAFMLAWKEPEQFWGIDVEPNPFSIPSLPNQERGTEVAFAPVQITGISSGTPISISGGGSPTFAISSTSTAVGDVRAKGSAAATINNGQWVRVWLTTSTNYSSSTTATLTVGTLSQTASASTKAEPGTGGGAPTIPTGTANYTVTTLGQLKNVVMNQLQPGQIVQLAAGNYKEDTTAGTGSGDFRISGKDWSGGSPAVIRSSSRPWGGYLGAGAGTVYPREGAWQSGSGGSELRYMNFDKTHNLVIDGFRTYHQPSTGNSYRGEIGDCRDLQFHYCKFNHNKPTTDPSQWYPQYQDTQTNGWVNARFLFKVGGAGISSLRLTFKHCIFSYATRGLYHPGGIDTLLEDCLFFDMGTDGIRPDGTNNRFTLRRTHFFRLYPQMDGTSTQPLGVSHPDLIQNYAGGSSPTDGGRYHVKENCILSVTGSNQAEAQGFFYEQDRPDVRVGPTGNTSRHNILFSTSTNMIRYEKGSYNLIENNTILMDFYARTGGAYRDPSSSANGGNQPMIVVHNPPNHPSHGNNTIRRNVAWAISGGIASDVFQDNVILNRANYGAQLFNYSEIGSSAVTIFNDYGVLQPAGLKRIAPKTTSSFHPNQADRGAWRTFDLYGALP